MTKFTRYDPNNVRVGSNKNKNDGFRKIREVKDNKTRFRLKGSNLDIEQYLDDDDEFYNYIDEINNETTNEDMQQYVNNFTYN